MTHDAIEKARLGMGATALGLALIVAGSLLAVTVRSLGDLPEVVTRTDIEAEALAPSAWQAPDLD